MLLSLSLLACLPQSPSPADAPDEVVAAPDVAVVGASVSGGFRLADWMGFVDDPRGTAAALLGREVAEKEFGLRVDSVAPARLIGAAYERDCASHADLFLFRSPERSARKLLTATFAGEAPELVIGVDLVFWFGYGEPQLDPAAGESVSEWRYALQARGLALLAEFVAAEPETTWVCGDYPDLTGALPLMISPAMIPTAAERAELNARLRTWAAERPSVHVFPLAQTLEDLRGGSIELEVDGQVRRVDPDSAFQLARVHPTRLGAAAMVRELFRWLAAQPTLPSELLPDLVTDATFVDAAGVSAGNFLKSAPVSPQSRPSESKQ